MLVTTQNDNITKIKNLHLAKNNGVVTQKPTILIITQQCTWHTQHLLRQPVVIFTINNEKLERTVLIVGKLLFDV